MKWKFLIALDIFLVSAFFIIPANAQENYGYIIVANRAANIKAPAIYDLQYYLKKGTGHDFKFMVSDSLPSIGVQIIRLYPVKDVGYDKRLPANDLDAFLIESDGKHSLKIIAYFDRGLANGIYAYLEKLGFRWFHPGEEWTYVPTLKNICMVINQKITPDFSMRAFFGSYGTPRNYYADPTKIVDKAWAQWAYRNRMEGGLKGHSWNEFLWRNIQELLQHPEYMAMVDGKRVKPNTAMKFCISNKGFQQLFIKDMVAQLKAAMGNDKFGTYYISVEPSDGEGDCECDECKKLGSVSNRDFLLANLVAKEFQKISPNAYVNLYAYDTHAAPPDFELERNVAVQIIPYGFQNFSSPEEMIAAWKKKNHDLYIYDYYGLPINNLDMPLKGALEPLAFARRLKYWYDQHIKGANLESSYSIGSTGIGLYLFAHMTWDIHRDPNQLIDEYYELNYGKAAPVLKQVQQILSDTTIKNAEALVKAAHLLKVKTQALSLAEKQKSHLTDYKAYLVYLKLLYKVQNGSARDEPAASDTLMRYAYSIFQTMMVHQLPLSEYMRSYGPTTAYIQQYWNYLKEDDKAMKFSTVKQLTAPEIDAMFSRMFD